PLNPATVLNDLELSAFAPSESSKTFRRTLFMTIINRLLTLSIALSCGLIIGGLAYAQEAPKAKDDSKFDFKFDDDFDFDFDFPDAPQGDRTFTFFLQGTFLGVHVEDISKDNMSAYGMREVSVG